MPRPLSTSPFLSPFTPNPKPVAAQRPGHINKWKRRREKEKKGDRDITSLPSPPLLSASALSQGGPPFPWPKGGTEAAFFLPSPASLSLSILSSAAGPPSPPSALPCFLRRAFMEEAGDENGEEKGTFCFFFRFSDWIGKKGEGDRSFLSP